MKWFGAAARKTRPPKPEYLYLPCLRAGRVQPVPIVKRTAKLIYYSSDSWDRRQAVVSPGAISYEQFEADRPGPAGGLFFITRQAAEDYLGRVGHRPAGSGPAPAPSLKALRQAMVDAHPDRGGTVEQFIQAHRRYQDALRLPAIKT